MVKVHLVQYLDVSEREYQTKNMQLRLCISSHYFYYFIPIIFYLFFGKLLPSFFKVREKDHKIKKENF